MDDDEGYTFWEVIPKHRCDRTDQYQLLYDGIADKLIDTDYENAQTIYSVKANDFIFALTKKDEFQICGFNVIVTEHPKLFVVETKGHGPFARSLLTHNNEDVLSYLNSKIVYVERHVRTQVNMLYRDVIRQQCLLERQILQNALTLATIAPDEAAIRLTKQHGFVASVAGETIYLIKCLPVDVKVRQTKQCFQHLPVEWQNESYYLTPRTHILTKNSVKIECNSMLPAQYKIGPQWFMNTPNMIPGQTPNIIKPMSKISWSYVNPGEWQKKVFIHHKIFKN